jgi:hypothetical protein
MKKFIPLIATVLLFQPSAQAFDVKLLANNKETLSRQITKQDLSKLEVWKRQHRLREQELKTSSLNVLADTFNEMQRIDTNCELGLIDRLQEDAKKHGIIVTENETLLFITYLRSMNLIDDVLTKLLVDSAYVKLDFDNAKIVKPKVRALNLVTRQNSQIDLKKFYAPFKTWPDDIKACTFDTFYNATRQLTSKNQQDLDTQLLKLNLLAHRNGVIDLITYNKLESLRVRKVLNWDIYFDRYADIITNAKDKLTKNPEVQAKQEFTVEYVSRKEKLTNRGSLYSKYNSTQIMILAQVIEKTAKRMDASRVSLNWQYTDDPTGETEVYIFSPMEQYRAAIKMLRKDMAELMRSESFKNHTLEYEHIIAAAYETGFIKSEELSYVLKFEEFWNPKVPKWKAYANFAFSLAGSAVFYLPPPWNVLGSIGLIMTQSRVFQGDRQPDPDENWNVII